MVNILCDPPRLSYISGLLFSRLKGKLVVGNASIFHALSVHSEPGSAWSVLRALPIHSPPSRSSVVFLPPLWLEKRTPRE